MKKRLFLMLLSCAILSTTTTVSAKSVVVENTKEDLYVNSLDKMQNYFYLCEKESEVRVEPVIEVDNTKYTGWISTTVNVRTKPSKKSKIVGKLYFNDKVKYQYTDNTYKWAKIKYDGETAYVCADYVIGEKCQRKTMSVPFYKGFKSWMGYKAITCKSSPQYKIQQIAYTGNYGIRMVGNRYCVALASHYTTEIGQYFDLILKNGTVIPCVLADAKANCHTDSANIFTVVGANKCASEFIVDTNALHRAAKSSGDISSVNESWNSPVAKVRLYEKNIFD